MSFKEPQVPVVAVDILQLAVDVQLLFGIQR
jgi:hypothetical protein